MIAAAVLILLLCCGCSAFSHSEGYSASEPVPEKMKDVPSSETPEVSPMSEAPPVSVQKAVPGSGASEEGSSEEEVAEETRETDAEPAPLIVEADPALYTYEDMEQDILSLAHSYDCVTADSLGKTMDGREIYHLLIGREDAPVHILFTASIHAREYITTQLLMKQTDEFLKDRENDYLDEIAIHVVPMINPDGVAISQFGLDGIRTQEAKDYVTGVIMPADGSTGSPSYFTRWKANAHGVDLNRNFDALWEAYAGSGHPSSDHYKGESPGSEPEAAALIRLTEDYSFARTVSYHTQGGVIYWYFGQEGALKEETEQLAKDVSAVTGYYLDSNYQNLDPAGYKDWAISKMGIPSLTVEVGRETSPVPPAQFSEIWEQNKLVWKAVCDNVLSSR